VTKADVARVTYGDPVWELIAEVTRARDDAAVLASKVNRHRRVVKRLLEELWKVTEQIRKLEDSAAVVLQRREPPESLADSVEVMQRMKDVGKKT